MGYVRYCEILTSTMANLRCHELFICRSDYYIPIAHSGRQTIRNHMSQGMCQLLIILTIAEPIILPTRGTGYSSKFYLL